MRISTRNLLTCTLAACFYRQCDANVLKDIPAKDCTLCDDDRVLNERHIVTGFKSCQQIDMDGGDLSTESEGDFLSPCAEHQQKYQDKCCAKSLSASDSSLTLENEEHHEAPHKFDNIFSTRTAPDEAELEIVESESLNTAEFGVRRENLYSTSHATSTERLSVLVTMLALVLSMHAVY